MSVNVRTKKFDKIKGIKNFHIALVMGGLSAEREVSLMSAKPVLESLVNLGYTVTPIDMGYDISNIIKEINPDLVFNCLHGQYGEDGCLPGVLEIMKIPYTHAGVAASALGMNKYLSRKLFLYYGLDCPEFVVLDEKTFKGIEPFPRPYVIKPISEGSSVGVKLIKANDEFDIKQEKFPLDGKLMVEKYIKGREINVAVINGKAIGAIEIKPMNEFYDYEAKYTDGKSEHIMPAPLSEALRERILKISESAYQAINCTGVARVDIIYEETEDKFYVLEINTHPGMTNLSLVPEIAKYYGIDFEQLLQLIIDDALTNGKNNQEKLKEAI